MDLDEVRRASQRFLGKSLFWSSHQDGAPTDLCVNNPSFNLDWNVISQVDTDAIHSFGSQDGVRRMSFDYDNFWKSTSDSYRSVNFIRLAEQAANPDGDDISPEVVPEKPDLAAFYKFSEAIRAELDEAQLTCFNLALTGVLSCIQVIEGYPGSGKTFLHAHINIALMLLGFRAFFIAPRNDAIKAFMEHLTTAIDRYAPQLKGRFTWLHSSADTRDMRARLDDKFADTSDIKTYQFPNVVASDAVLREIGSGSEYNKFSDQLRGYSLIACTTNVAFRLKGIFQAHVIMGDEQAQAPDTDIIQPAVFLRGLILRDLLAGTGFLACTHETYGQEYWLRQARPWWSLLIILV